MTDSPVARNFGPRSMFYSARDLRLEKPGLSLMAIVREQGARQHLINEAVRASELLINSIRTIKPFDEMGNVELTVAQIEEARSNALAKVTNLLEAIQRTNARVREHANLEYSRPEVIWPPDQVVPEAVKEPVELPLIQGPTPADMAKTRTSISATPTVLRYSTTGLRP